MLLSSDLKATQGSPLSSTAGTHKSYQNQSALRLLLQEKLSIDQHAASNFEFCYADWSRSQGQNTVGKGVSHGTTDNFIDDLLDF